MYIIMTIMLCSFMISYIIPECGLCGFPNSNRSQCKQKNVSCRLNLICPTCPIDCIVYEGITEHLHIWLREGGACLYY